MSDLTIYDFDAQTIDGKPMALADLRGQVVLVVNTASKCGFTPQFEGLEAMSKKFKERGLAVIGFPSNEFGHQDPGTNAEIGSFCQMNYGVSFPMMSKIHVNGPDAHPLYRWMKEQAPGLLGTKAIKWNFTKFLIGRDGHVVKRYSPTDTPASIEKDVSAALG